MMRYVYAACLGGLASALPTNTAAQQPIPLDTVRVEAGSRLVAGATSFTRAVEVLDRDAIDALPARSVIDVIGRALGADLLARSPAQADLAIRGSSFEQVLILVDGVPVNDQQTGHFHLDVAVPLDAVERIEILRGPASSVYGSSAVGGVVNIVTRRFESGLGARVQAGSFGTWAIGVDGAVAMRGAVVRLSADRDASDGHRPGTDYSIGQARIAVDAPLGTGTLAADIGLAERDFGAAEFYAPYDSWEETLTTTASVAWRGALGAVALEPRAWWRSHDDDFTLVRGNPAIYRNVHTTRQTGGELVARWQPRPRLAVAIGGDVSQSRIESNALGDRSEDRVAAFVEAAAGDASAALATAGFRLDRHSTFGVFGSASASAGYQATSRLRLHGSVSNGFRAPSWTDRYYEDPANIGSPDLQPERFWTAEVGATLNRDATSFAVAGFVRQAHDLIDWGRDGALPASAPWRTLNLEDATFYGIETTAQAKWRPLVLTGRASLLTFDAAAADGMVSKYALQPLTRALSLDALVPVSSHASVSVRGHSARRADGEAWESVDMRITATAFGVQVFVDATNLFDARWLDVSAQPVAGRAFAIGARTRR